MDLLNKWLDLAQQGQRFAEAISDEEYQMRFEENGLTFSISSYEFYREWEFTITKDLTMEIDSLPLAEIETLKKYQCFPKLPVAHSAEETP